MGDALRPIETLRFPREVYKLAMEDHCLYSAHFLFGFFFAFGLLPLIDSENSSIILRSMT